MPWAACPARFPNPPACTRSWRHRANAEVRFHALRLDVPCSVRFKRRRRSDTFREFLYPRVPRVHHRRQPVPPAATPIPSPSPIPTAAVSSRFIAASKPGPGFSVALSGGGATLVGADFANDTKGAAYLFSSGEAVDSSDNNAPWILEKTLAPSDSASGDLFGSAVALSTDGAIALVGAPGKRGETGAAYVFTRIGGNVASFWHGATWIQQELLLPTTNPTGGDLFGSSVALSGDGTAALIGAPGANGGGGAVFYFTLGVAGWSLVQELTPSDASEGDRFGCSVALSPDGGTVVVGADGKDGLTGAAYVFTLGGDWAQQEELRSGVAGGEFGYSVAVGPGGILIGARDAAYAFSAASSWADPQRLPLTASGGDGYSVALSADGSTALVGALGTGAAYLFSWGDATWGGEQVLRQATDSSESTGFGYSVCLSIDGSIAAVGDRGVGVLDGADVFAPDPVRLAIP